MKKRMLAMLLTLCMALSLLPASALAAGTFSDVDVDDWFYADVEYAAENGLMNGTGGGKFSPNDTTTRAMIVTVLHRMAGTPEASAPSAFADVAPGAWYAAAVAWAAEQGVVLGMDAKTFAPDTTITREQFATILYRYAEKSGMDVGEKAPLAGFTDAGQISAYAEDAMAWANAAGLIRGVSDTLLDPIGGATRAQAAAILHRFALLRGTPETPAAPGTVTLTVDKKDATVTEPRQTFTGTFTVENDQIDRINWTLANADMTGNGVAMIDQTNGTWMAADVLLGAGKNVITFTAYTKTGETAVRAVERTYDPGTLADYHAEDLTMTGDGHGYANDVILVILDASRPAAERDAALQAVCAAVNGTVVGQLNTAQLYQVRVARGTEDELLALCKKAEAIGGAVLCAALDYAAPRETEEPESKVADRAASEGGAQPFAAAAVTVTDSWGGASWSETSPEGYNWWAEAIRARYAWYYDAYFKTIRVGVSDSGFNTAHEDLNDASVTVLSSGNRAPSNHGTIVAGIIGATPNNGKGITGLVWHKELYLFDYDYAKQQSYADNTLRLDTGGLDDVQALIDADCRVINYSAGIDGTSSNSTTIQNYDKLYSSVIKNFAVSHPKFLITKSAGNDSCDVRRKRGFCAVTDAEALEHLMIVASVDKPASDGTYTLRGASCYGDMITVAAPGQDVYSAGNSGSDSYVADSGTSFAAPIVAGVAAMVWSVNPGFSAAEVRQIVADTATTTVGKVNSADTRSAYPMVNAQRAVEQAIALTYGEHAASGRFVNAETGAAVGNVPFTVQRGGAVVYSGVSNPDGTFTVTLPRADADAKIDTQIEYTLVSGGSYLAASTPFTINTIAADGTNAIGDVALTSALSSDTYRIVLTWNESPADLDAHLVADTADGADSIHVFYRTKSALDGVVSLDLDDAQFYGPETITVHDATALQGFTFCVHDFTNRANAASAALAASGATVRVYRGNTLLTTYTVPENRVGTVWDVFTLGADGALTEINEIGYTEYAADIGRRDTRSET